MFASQRLQPMIPLRRMRTPHVASVGLTMEGMHLDWHACMRMSLGEVRGGFDLGGSSGADAFEFQNDHVLMSEMTCPRDFLTWNVPN